MCRNIKSLYNFEPPATDKEIEAAALQFVRKISGFSKPSIINESAFGAAVADTTVVIRRLLDTLSTHAPPRSREAEAIKAQARAAARFHRA